LLNLQIIVSLKEYLNFCQITGLYSYKIHGEMNGVKPEICVQVYMDIDYRKEWDNYVKGLFNQMS